MHCLTSSVNVTPLQYHSEWGMLQCVGVYILQSHDQASLPPLLFNGCRGGQQLAQPGPFTVHQCCMLEAPLSDSALC